VARAWDWLADTGTVRIGVTTSRRDQTTSTVIVSGEQALLIDPAWDPDELAEIAGDLAAAGVGVTAGFATHGHHDHLLWPPGLGSVPRWASAPVARHATTHRTALVQALGPDWPAELAELVGVLTAVDGSRLPWPGATVEMITHDAHAPGHTALWLPEQRVLVAGDMLSDVELPLLEQSSVADYLDGLAALEPVVRRASVLVPGHGRPAIGAAAAVARWVADERYLEALVAGADPRDPRQSRPGMPEAHRHNISRVQA